jgi:hypothetical protein
MSSKSGKEENEGSLRIRMLNLDLEKEVGTRGSIFIMQMIYWLVRTRHFFDGWPWFYKAYSDWLEEFPNWGLNSIQRLVRKLGSKGLGLIRVDCRKNKSKNDWTNWYTINFEHEIAIKCGLLEMMSKASQNSKHRSSKRLTDFIKMVRTAHQTDVIQPSDGTHENTTRENPESSSSSRPDEEDAGHGLSDNEDVGAGSAAFQKSPPPPETRPPPPPGRRHGGNAPTLSAEAACPISADGRA